MRSQNIQFSSQINNMIIDVKKNTITPPKKGFANDAKDFFDQMIKWQFGDKETIKSIHRSLMEYIHCDNPVFAIRLYGSAAKDKYYLLRRGFLSEYQNGIKAFFCDNTFAMPFAALKLHNKAYTASDLIEHLNQKNVVCGFGSTSEERELSYYKCNGCNRINLNTSGWYLAHIIPVGYDFKDESRLSQVFKNPNRKEWERESDHVRHTDESLNEYEYSILVAHFLRLIHPLNSFLIPKNNFVVYAGKRLGEEQELINIVQEYIKKEFPEEYAELQSLMQIPEPKDAENAVGNIAWSLSEYEIKKYRKNIPLNPQPVISKKKDKKVLDEYDDNKECELSNKLKSIGKRVFLELYPLVKNNIDITVSEIEEIYPKYKGKADSKRTCLSSTRSIIKNGLDVEAMEIIAEAPHMNEECRLKARHFLELLLK